MTSTTSTPADPGTAGPATTADELHTWGAGPVAPVQDTVLRPLAAAAVRLLDGQLGRLQRANSATSIHHGADHLERERAWLNYDAAAQGRRDAQYFGPFFEDGEVYKFLEAAAWDAGRTGDAELVSYLVEHTQRIRTAQDLDGYLNTFVQCGQRGDRFERLDMDHEIFNVGALVQSAVAQYRATGHPELLDVARRAADQLDRTFGPGKRAGTCGHPLIEMALVELYRTTREPRYLELARYFVDVRGHGVLAHQEGLSAYYLSDRVPVRETTTPEGHAVRAVYLAAGATDVAIETGNTRLLDGLQLQWQNMVDTKMYVTGGLGSRWDGEAFGDPFELPSDRAYAETCAGIASMQWSWRLLLATGNAKYADLFERQFYNAVLPGVSADGDSYFYVNALQVRDGAVADDDRSPVGGRHQWFGCSCCPTNLMRTLASIGCYVATSTGDGLQLHQYTACEIVADGSEDGVRVFVETDYPWSGAIAITVEGAPAEWSLSVRIPAWAVAATAWIGDEQLDVTPGQYLVVRRKWAPGTMLQLDLGVTPRFTKGRPQVDSERGALAIERGPLVYAVEQVDNPGVDLDALSWEADPSLAEQWQPDLLGGIPTVVMSPRGPASDQLPPVTAIPYFLWANRELGPMRIWVPAT